MDEIIVNYLIKIFIEKIYKSSLVKYLKKINNNHLKIY